MAPTYRSSMRSGFVSGTKLVFIYKCLHCPKLDDCSRKTASVKVMLSGASHSSLVQALLNEQTTQCAHVDEMP